MGAVKNLCNRGVVLDQGQVTFDGNVDKAVEYYTNSAFVKNEWRKEIRNIEKRIRSTDVQITSVEFVNQKSIFSSDEPIRLLFNIHATQATNNCRINLTIFFNGSTPIGTVSNTNCFQIEANGNKQIIITLKNHHLSPGLYDMSFSIGTGNYLNSELNFEVVPHIMPFEISTALLDPNKNISQWNNAWGHVIFDSETEVL